MRHMLLVFLGVYITCALATGFEELATIDCNGGLHAAEGFGLGATARIPELPGLYDWYHSRIYSRMQCACTGADAISEAQFYQFYAYTSIDFYMNSLLNPAKPQIPCQQFYTQNCKIATTIINVLNNVSFSLPAAATCTYADWAAGRTCALKYDVLPGITGQLAMRKCPNSNFPFMSLTCGGAGCSRIGMPCNANSECGTGQNCTAVADLGVQLGITTKPCFTKKRTLESVEHTENSLDDVAEKISLPAKLFLGIIKGFSSGHQSVISEVRNVLTEAFAVPEPSSQKRGTQQTCSTGTAINASTLFQGMVNAHFYDTTDNPATCVAPNVFFGNIVNIVRGMYGVTSAYTVPASGSLPINICTPPITSFNVSQFTNDICTYSNNTSVVPFIIDCSQNINSWDGVLDSGQSAVDTSRLNGDFIFPNPPSTLPPLPYFASTPSGTPRIPLGSMSCDGTINFLPQGGGGIGAQALAYVLQAVGSPQSTTGGLIYDGGWLGFVGTAAAGSISMQIPNLRGVINEFFNNIQTQTGCRKSLTSFSALQTKLRFAFPLDFVLYYMTSPVTPVNTGPSFSDWTSTFTTFSTKLLMPETCTFATWTDPINPLCALYYDGIQALFGTGITIRLAAVPCSNPAGSADPGAYLGPQINVDCVGKFCSLLTTTKYCSTNSDCTDEFGDGVICVDYEAGVTSTFDPHFAYFNGGLNAPYGDTCFNSANAFADFGTLPNAGFIGTSGKMQICSLDYRTIFSTSSTNYNNWISNQFVSQGAVAANQYLFPWPSNPIGNELFTTAAIVTGSSDAGIPVFSFVVLVFGLLISVLVNNQ